MFKKGSQGQDENDRLCPRRKQKMSFCVRRSSSLCRRHGIRSKHDTFTSVQYHRKQDFSRACSMHDSGYYQPTNISSENDFSFSTIQSDRRHPNNYTETVFYSSIAKEASWRVVEHRDKPTRSRDSFVDRAPRLTAQTHSWTLPYAGFWRAIKPCPISCIIQGSREAVEQHEFARV